MRYTNFLEATISDEPAITTSCAKCKTCVYTGLTFTIGGKCTKKGKPYKVVQFLIIGGIDHAQIKALPVQVGTNTVPRNWHVVVPLTALEEYDERLSEQGESVEGEEGDTQNPTEEAQA